MQKWAVLFLLAFAGTASADAWEDIRHFCVREWPGSQYRMQAYCVKTQQEAAMTVLSLTRGEAKEEGDLRNLLGTCIEKWRGEQTQVNWRMVAYCYKTEREAYSFMQQ
ncbi:hypothetical protein AB395_00003378 [Sinorhizobium fredii CCBAU 45436]|nr:hypothetical protein AB395_00003378 [Sinorhizobium fredii CCBAU 45436]